MTTDDGLGPDETALDGVGLPAVPVSAGALIFDRAGRPLILKPTYKTAGRFPAASWSPTRRRPGKRATARLACMDFRRPRPGKPGGIRYLFDCGAFSDADLAGIVVQPEEISEYRLAELSTALTLLRKPIRRRVRAAARGRRLCYLEDGLPVPAVGQPRAGR